RGGRPAPRLHPSRHRPPAPGPGVDAEPAGRRRATPQGDRHADAANAAGERELTARNARTTHRCHRPRKRAIQYSPAPPFEHWSVTTGPGSTGSPAFAGDDSERSAISLVHSSESVLVTG